MKRIITVILLLSMMLTLCCCDRVVSSYSAIGLVRSQSTHKCESSFYSLSGRLVFKIKPTEGGGEINYSLRSDNGEIRLSYDIDGERVELATVGGGEALEGVGGFVNGGVTVHVIIEAEKSGGTVSVWFES